MILQFQDWTFDVDIAATMKYSAHLVEEHCECGYCRNYYQTVSGCYPSLDPFLKGFGIHLEGPVDFLPVEPTVCVVSYAVCGRILEKGSGRIEFPDVSFFVEESSELDYTLSCQEPYFVFTTNALILPWVLPEDMDEVVSPANEPECLERMWRKVLNMADFDTYQS